MTKSTTIGVLALQGAFIEHVNMLNQVLERPEYQNQAAQVTEVRTVNDLSRCDALVIPGGESTSISLVAQRSGMMEPLREFVRTKPTWGTCAGLILLANEVTDPKHKDQQLIGGMDISVARNHFGRQVDSFSSKLKLDFLPHPEVELQCVFIRAPVVQTVGKSVQILATVNGGNGDRLVVAVKQNNLFGTSFHPELTSDNRVHEYFLKEFVFA